MAERFKPHCTVAIIIEHNDKILMVEEKDEFGNVVFGIPAGHVDMQESIIHGALREGAEEIGAEIELEHLVGIYDYVKEDATILRFCFKAHLKTFSENLTPADPDGDILAVKWYDKDAIYKAKQTWRTRLVGLCLEDYYKGNAYPLSIIRSLGVGID